MAKSARWKDLERKVAKVLGGQRILRDDRDRSVSAPDVAIQDPRAKIDCKSRDRHAHHTLFQEVERKYCKTPDDYAIMVTRETRRGSQRGQPRDPVILATVRLEVLARLLDPGTMLVRTLDGIKAGQLVGIAGTREQSTAPGEPIRVVINGGFLVEGEHRTEPRIPIRRRGSR